MNHQQIYENIIKKAKSKNRQKGKSIYYENHHINPVCLGGSNDADNLVLLTAREHYIAHKLLTYIYPNNRKIATVFHYMTFGKTYYNQSSRDYEYARKLASELSKGKNHPFFGKTHSIETKIKQSKSLKGHNVSREVREKISNSRKGIKFSEEHIRNLSESHKGISQTEETKRKISKSLQGRSISSGMEGKSHSKETKQKMADSAKRRGISKETQIKMLEGRKNSKKIKGRKRSEETKQRMREAWEKRKQKE
jgi:hypothetical protein